jgi:methylenetetrahydrofolate reductase (NADPH)
MVLGARAGKSDADRLLAGYSLEMTAKDRPALAEAAARIPAGTLINVTFLANEDTPLRVAAAQAIREAGFLPVPHIAARRLTDQRELEAFLDALATVDASEQVVVIGGDPPQPLGPYPGALELIRSGVLEKYGVRQVSISGYPEGHPDISEPVLWEAMKAKRDALAERGIGASITTQFGFDADAVLRWIDDVRGRGIELPIRVGVPGPAGVRRLLRYAKRFGAATSASIVQKYGFSLTNLVGSAGPDRFVRDLADGYDADRQGTVRLHFYTFGGLAATADWLHEFREAA